MSVVVLTCAGARQLRACLRGLAASEVRPLELVVVDGSPAGRLDGLLRREFPAARVVRNPAGPRARRGARRIGAAATTGEIIAFIDDDAVPDRSWLGTLLAHFADPTVAGVGGRLLARDARRRSHGTLPGRVLADGRLTAGFRVDLRRPAAVHSLSGVNMAFRRSALGELEAQEYPGTAQWEDADLCWQVREGGGRLVFEPRAVVHYESGRPRVGGRQRTRAVRDHYAVRNNLALLIRRRAGAALVGHFLLSTARSQLDHLNDAGRLLRGHEAGGPWGVRGAAGKLAVIAGEVSGLALGAAAGLLSRTARGRQRIVAGQQP